MDEAALIARLCAEPQPMRDDVVLGVGDDAALTVPPAGHQLVIANDTLCEGTHFPAGMPADALGWRALAVNLSDLAAMAAEPMWASLSLSLPRADEDWVSQFAAGFFRLARRHDVALIGGDTVCGPVQVAVTVYGCVRPGVAVRRSGAAPGDAILVTGWPGEAAAACRRELAGPSGFATDDVLTRRFLYPEPRVREGIGLSGLASAMIDLSDGLAIDLQRLLRASGAGAGIDVANVPLSDALRAQLGHADALAAALNGGDDYELCFTLPPAAHARWREISASWTCAVTELGKVERDGGLRWIRNGQPWTPPDTGFRHF